MTMNIEMFASSLLMAGMRGTGSLYINHKNECTYSVAIMKNPETNKLRYTIHPNSFEGHSLCNIRKKEFDGLITKEYFKEVVAPKITVPEKLFLQTIEDKKIIEKFEKITDDDVFHNEFYDYMEVDSYNNNIYSDKYDEFEENFYKQFAIEYCEKNNIPYTLEPFVYDKSKDKFDLNIAVQYARESEEDE